MAFLKTDYTTYGDDWTINYTLKTITNNDSATGNNVPSKLGTYDRVGSTYNWFRWLATTFANSTQMDDTYPVQSDTPTVYKFLNGWTFGNANDYKYLNGGSVEDPLGSGSTNADSLWTNVYSIGTQVNGTQIYALYDDTVVATPWWISSDGTAAGNIDILIPVKLTGTSISSPDTAGVATDGGVWFYARETGDSFDHNFVDLSAGGRNPVGINTALDGSNESGELYLSVTSSTGFTVGKFVEGTTSGAVGKIISIVGNDIYLNAVRAGINAGATATFVISETLTEYSDREGQTATGQSTTNDGATAFTNVVAGYTDTKYAFVQRDFTGGTTATGPFQFGETVTQTTSGATFKFVAEVSNVLYMEDLTGTPDGTNLLTGGTSGATYTPTATAAATSVNQDLNNGAGVQPYNVFLGKTTRSPSEIYEWTKYISRYGSSGATYTLNADDGQEYRSADEGTYAETKTAPFGTLAGTTFYGATGVWMAEYTTADFVLIDANGVTQSPPNYQSVSATHSSLSGCNVLVCKISAGSIIKNQYTISTVTSSTIVATTTIDINETPQGDTEAGTIIVGDTRYKYTSFSGSTFSGVTPDPTGETGDFYVPLLSLTADATTETSSNIIYDADIAVRTSVRKYGFKPYDVDTSFGSTGLSFAPILATDPQAN